MFLRDGRLWSYDCGTDKQSQATQTNHTPKNQFPIHFVSSLVTNAKAAGTLAFVDLIYIDVVDFCSSVAEAIFSHQLDHTAAVDSCPKLSVVVEGKISLEGTSICGESCGCRILFKHLFFLLLFSFVTIL
jgi:flavoprotein